MKAARNTTQFITLLNELLFISSASKRGQWVYIKNTAQDCHGQEKQNFFKGREMSVNFVFGLENLEFCSKSGKSQGMLCHFGYYEVFLYIY